MKDQYETWYVRLPDGRIVTAKSTQSVRHHVEAGNIPLNSTARRDPMDEWISLAWIADFSDLGANGIRSLTSMKDGSQSQGPSSNGSSPDISLKSGVSSRLDPMRLQTVGVRGLVDELIAAFDSTVGSRKLVAACAAGTIGSLAVFLLMRAMFLVYPEGGWLAQLLGGITGAGVLAFIVALLTRQTHMELTKMQPVFASEAAKGISSFAFRVFLGYVATIGVCIGLLILLQHVPEWLGKATHSLSATIADILQTAAWAVGLVLAISLFATMLLSLLLPPILVVEECSVGDAIREWRSLLHGHRMRVMVYEGMALALAFVAALPLALPVWLGWQYGPALGAHSLNWFSAAIPKMLVAFAAGPALAFMAVANLFIYLNLRYEYSPGK